MEPLDLLRKRALSGDAEALRMLELFAEIGGMNRLREDLAKRLDELAVKHGLAKPEVRQ